MIIKFRSSIIATVLLVTVGCTQTISPSSDSESIALIPRGVEIIEVDGKTVSMFSSGVRTGVGEHTLKARVAASGFLAPEGKPVEKQINFQVEAGKSYLVKSSSTYRPCIWVEEEAAKKVVSWDNEGCGAFPPKKVVTAQ